MNSPKPYIPREPASLKEAVTDLVTACGGQDRAAALTRVSPSQIQRYTAPDQHDYQMPADVVQALEMACGKPLVTRFLAMATGNVLISTGPGDGLPLSADMGAFGRDAASMFEEFSRAMADGKIEAREAADIERRAFAVIDAAASVIAECRRIRKGGGA